MASEETSGEHHAHEAHASIAKYSGIAIFLAIVTAVEVVVLFVDISAYSNELILGSLYLMMLIKFVGVVGWFMHLRYDHIGFTVLFTAGMVFALGTYFALEVMIGNVKRLEDAAYRPERFQAGPHTVRASEGEAAHGEKASGGHGEEASGGHADEEHAEKTTEVAAAEQAAGEQPAKDTHAQGDAGAKVAEGDPEAGKQVFVQNGCGACHKIASVPSAGGTVGPELDGLMSRAGDRVAGQDAEAYIRESIVDPYAHVVDGYAKLMPPNQREQMSDQEFADLIAFLESL